MDNLSKDSEKFEPKLKVLKENVEHHAEEEEEKKMFSKARKLFSPSNCRNSGRNLKPLKVTEIAKRASCRVAHVEVIGMSA